MWMARYLLRRPELRQRIGRSDSAIDNDVRDGLIPPPVRCGPRSVAWPSDEVDAIVNARIAGDDDDEIRALVTRLVAARRKSSVA
jgi:prophage regulatory protein